MRYKLQFNGYEGREKRSDSTPRSFRCNQFHSPTQETKYHSPTKILPCAYCKWVPPWFVQLKMHLFRNGLVSEFLLSTQQCPSAQYYAGPRNFIQVSVCKKISSDSSETSDYAADIGNVCCAVLQTNIVYLAGAAVLWSRIDRQLADRSEECVSARQCYLCSRHHQCRLRWLPCVHNHRSVGSSSRHTGLCSTLHFLSLRALCMFLSKS